MVHLRQAEAREHHQREAWGFASEASGDWYGFPPVAFWKSSLAAATAAGSVRRSTVDAPSTFAATIIPLKPSGCAAQVVCAQWWAVVPSGRAATFSSDNGTTALTSPMSEDAVPPFLTA